MQQTDRPSVADNVVDRDQEHVLGCAQLQHLETQQWTVAQVERHFCFDSVQALNLSFLIASGEQPEIAYLESHHLRRRDQLNR